MFVENFAKNHPEATVDDLVRERYRLLVAHNCRETLANIAGHDQPEKTALQIVSPQAQSLMLAGRKFTRVDEYYNATTRVWNIIFVDDPPHPESYGNQLILNFYDWIPRPTVEAVASALSEERPGTKNIFLFKAPDESNGDLVYHIVSITRTQSIFVNLMRIAGWEKSAVNISFGHRLGTDPDKSETEARLWLLSAEGEAFRHAVAALRVGNGWREYLKLNVK
jgi:hypothetical protein